jgi:hypothetical protein
MENKESLKTQYDKDYDAKNDVWRDLLCKRGSESDMFGEGFYAGLKYARGLKEKGANQ